MPIDNVASVLVKTPQVPAGVNRTVARWHGDVTLTNLKSAALVNNQGLTQVDGYLRLDNHIYIDDGCNLRFANVSFNLRDFVIYIHPDASPLWLDCLLWSGDRRDGPNVTIFPEWGRYNADGGGILGTQVGANSKDRMHVFVGLINNVQIRQDGIGQNDMNYMPFLSSGTYNNVKALKVDGMNMNGNTDVVNQPIIMHDCEFRSTAARGARVGPLNNGSMILNDCIFGRVGRDANGNYLDTTGGGSDWMWDTTSAGVTRVPHHIYFCGKTKTRWSANWERTEAADNKLQSHQGGLRYYQVYKGGVVFGGARARLYSELDNGVTQVTAHRKSQITLGNNEMLELPTSAMGADGKFSVMTVAKTRLNELNSWNTHTQTNHILRVRERGIIFQDIVIQDPTVSIGRPDNPVPFVVQPDPHFDTAQQTVTIGQIDARVALNFSNKTIIIQDNTSLSVGQLYSYLKALHSDFVYFEHHMDQHFDGTTLWLEDWNLAIGDNCSLTTINGTRIVSVMGTITHGSTFHNAGVELIDVNGVSVFVGSPAPGARAIIKYGTHNPIYADVEDDPDDATKNPWSSLIPLNTDVTVVIKAPGYSYERYTFNTGNQTRLDARLPREPTIDLSVSFTDAERDAMAFQNRTTGNTDNSKDLEDGWLEIQLTGAVQLRDQLKKSRRIFDWHMSQNSGLLFLLNYVSEISGDPLNGKAFVYETDRTRCDCSNTDSESKIRWIKFVNTRADVTSRWGDPIYLPTGSDEAAIYVAPATRRSGKVIFDNVILQGRVGELVIADSAIRLAENPAYTGALAKANWDYLDTSTLLDNSFGKRIKDNLDARVSQVEGDGSGNTNNDMTDLGYFRIGNRVIAGGGLANHILEAAGTGVHPHQLFLVSQDAKQSGPYFNAELLIYDISGTDDGAQFIGGSFLNANGLDATTTYKIDAAAIDEDYLYLAIQNATDSQNTIHRIPLNTLDATTSYASMDIGFRASAMCINGNDLVVARGTSATIRLYAIPIALDAPGPQVANISDTDHENQYMGMAIVGEGTDRAIALCSGTRRMLEFALDYTYVDATDLGFDAMGAIWWQDHIWTVRRKDADNFYLQPLTLDYAAIRQEYLANLIRQNPQKVWDEPGQAAGHEANTIGAAIFSFLEDWALERESGNLTDARLALLANLSKLDAMISTLPASVWAVSDTSANHTDNSIGKSIISMLVNFAMLNVEGGGLESSKLNKLTNLDVLVSSRLASTDYTTPPTASAIKTELEADGSDLDTIHNVVDNIHDTARKIDAQTAAVNNYGWVRFPSNTYATGYVNHNGILSQILQDVDASNHVIGKRIHTATGLGIEDHTYHPITLTNKTIIAVADSPDSTYFIVKNDDTNAYFVYQQDHGENTEPNRGPIAQEPRALGWGPHGLYILEVISGNLNLRWTYNSTSQDFDTGITAGAHAAALAIIENTAYVLHNNILYTIMLDDEASNTTIASETQALTGSNLVVMHDVLWVYDDDKLYPLDGDNAKINTEWALTQRTRIENNTNDIKDDTGKLRYSGAGTVDDPYLVNAHASGITAEDLTVDLSTTNAKIDAVQTTVNAIPTTSYTTTLTNIVNTINTISTNVNAIPTAAKWTLQEISDAVRDLADYDDDGGTETSLKAVLDEILTDLHTLEQQLLSDTVDSNDTVLKRIKDGKTILDKFRFTSNDVKATLDGEKVVTDDASRLASKATGFATPTNVTDARDNVKTAITAAQNSINTNVDANETKIDEVKTVVDAIPTTAPATPANVTAAKDAIITDITDAENTITGAITTAHSNTDGKIDTVDTVVDKIDERTSKLVFESETASGTQEKLHTYTDVEVELPDGTDVNINLDTVENGILDIQNQLKTQGTDEAPTILDKLVATGADVEFIRQMQEADITITGTEIVFKVSGSDTVLARWLRRPETTDADYSGGRVTPVE